MSIRIKLKELRMKNNLTQQMVADKIGIKRTSYGMIENNNRNPGFRVEREIKKLFNYYDDDLFDLIS